MPIVFYFIYLEMRPPAVRTIVMLHGWNFEQLNAASFTLGIPAKDEYWFTVLAKCDGFAATYNPETKAIDAPCDTPLGGSFFHGAGVICAPWNRLGTLRAALGCPVGRAL